MADYPQGGYRNRGARELSTPERRNTIPPKQAGAVGRPPARGGGDLRNVTVIPPSSPPAVSGGGKTIHINGGQLQTIIDNGRIRNAPNAGNGLTIELTEKEYREVQQGKSRGMLRAILRALGRNPLFRDLRLRLALQILESLLDVMTNLEVTQFIGPYAQVGDGWEHWSYNPDWGPSMGFDAGGVTPEFMEMISNAPEGHQGHEIGTIAFRNGLAPPGTYGWENAPHPTTIFNQALPGQGPTERVASVFRVHGHSASGGARWHIMTSWRNRQETPKPFSWSLMVTTSFTSFGPFVGAMPTGSAKPKTGTKGNGGYSAPGTRTKTEPFPEPPPVRTRERKLRATGAAAALWFGLGSATEAMDLINSIWNALPKSVKYRAFVQNGYKKLNPYERAVVIYNNLDKVNIPRAILNVVQDQIEDVLWGKVGKGLGLATQVVAPNRPIGLGAGGWTRGIGYQFQG